MRQYEAVVFHFCCGGERGGGHDGVSCWNDQLQVGWITSNLWVAVPLVLQACISR